jgi:hypothetical protein
VLQFLAVQICGSISVRAQISRHRGLVMWVAVSHAAMHSGMFLPVAPPMSDEPPLVAMTSPGVVSTAVTDADDADKKSGIAPLMGAWASHPGGGIWQHKAINAKDL